MLLLYRVLQYLCNTAEMKSIVLPYMEVKVCTHCGYGYVICAFYLILCLCGQYVAKILLNPVCIYI